MIDRQADDPDYVRRSNDPHDYELVDVEVDPDARLIYEIDLDDELRTRIRELAQTRGTRVSSLLVQAAREFADRNAGAARRAVGEERPDYGEDRSSGG